MTVGPSRLPDLKSSRREESESLVELENQAELNLPCDIGGIEGTKSSTGGESCKGDTRLNKGTIVTGAERLTAMCGLRITATTR